mgnify:CR=1 FL=1
MKVNGSTPEAYALHTSLKTELKYINLRIQVVINGLQDRKSVVKGKSVDLGGGRR